MYGGPDLAAAAQGSSPTCGHLLHVTPTLSSPFPLIPQADKKRGGLTMTSQTLI